jgi:hypothetical protein
LNIEKMKVSLSNLFVVFLNIWETNTLQIATFRKHSWGPMDGYRSC